MRTSTKVKLAVPPIIFGITFIGQLFHSVIIERSYHISLLLFSLSYSLVTGLIGYFVIDLVMATGNLRRKIRFIKLLSLYFVLLMVIDRYLISDSNLNLSIAAAQLILTALIVVFILVSDNFFRPKRDFDYIPEIRQLPQKYLRSKPFQTILETIFRLFPFPEPVALYRVGEPSDMSPVIVTGNYELTVRRVAKALVGLDCWFLVCDSRGINVWCSSLSGHFSGEDIIDAVKLTNLSEYVSHKKLILPQLCAAGVDIKDIRQKTGFTAVFGPVYIGHIKDFLDRKGDESRMRRVEFGVQQRIEMAIGSPIILTAVLTFIYLFVDISKLLFVLPAVYSISVVHAVIYPQRPIKRIPLWSLLYSSGIAVVIAAILIPTKSFSLGWSIGIVVTIGVGIFYLINEFEGWSPLVKYNLKSIYRGVNIPEIRINGERCIGCRLCFEVCPKGVFTVGDDKTPAGKAVVLDRKECIDCTACYTRCPTGAVVHSFDRREKGKCACVYCRVQDSLRE